MADQLTFEKLFDILRTEKSNPALQRMPDTFFSDVVGYLEAKTALVKKDSRVGDYDMATQQLRNARKVVQEIFDRREKKIVSLALSKSRMSDSVTDTSTMLEEELQFYTSAVEMFADYRKNVFRALLDLKLPYEGKFTHVPQAEIDDADDTDGAASYNSIKSGESDEEVNSAASEQAKDSDNAKEATSSSEIEYPKFEILADMPEFMGPDMNMYGPFEAGRQVELPPDVAKMLTGNGQAKSV